MDPAHGRYLDRFVGYPEVRAVSQHPNQPNNLDKIPGRTCVLQEWEETCPKNGWAGCQGRNSQLADHCSVTETLGKPLPHN